MARAKLIDFIAAASLPPRFAKLMVKVRDELVVVENSTVKVVEDFRAKLPQVLADSLKS